MIAINLRSHLEDVESPRIFTRVLRTGGFSRPILGEKFQLGGTLNIHTGPVILSRIPT